MSTTPVALILGAGANVGHNVGLAFAAKGYKIALAARSVKEEESTPDQLLVKGDFSDPSSMVSIFDKVKAKLGLPHVVVYNGMSLACWPRLKISITNEREAGAVTPRDAKHPLGLALTDFNRDFAINTTTPFVAAQQAVDAFNQLPDTASKTFIYTGNCTNVSPIVGLMDLGIGKSATAHMIQCASEAYKDKGYK